MARAPQTFILSHNIRAQGIDYYTAMVVLYEVGDINRLESSTYVVPLYRALIDRGFRVEVGHPKKTRARARLIMAFNGEIRRKL